MQKKATKTKKLKTKVLKKERKVKKPISKTKRKKTPAESSKAFQGVLDEARQFIIESFQSKPRPRTMELPPELEIQVSPIERIDSTDHSSLEDEESTAQEDLDAFVEEEEEFDDAEREAFDLDSDDDDLGPGGEIEFEDKE